MRVLPASTLAVLMAAATLCGCGGSPAPPPACVIGTTFGVGPATGTASHLAASPGNQVKFTADGGEYAVSGNCALTNLITQIYATWASSDPAAVSVDSTESETNGLATCLTATNGPITLTATPPANGGIYKPTSATVALTCN